MKIKAIYLIQEAGCLNPQSGAFQHISVGYKQLSKAFDMTAFFNNQSINLSDYITNESPSKNSEKIRRVKKRGLLYGSIKDLQLILQYILNIPRLYKALKANGINLIYERTAYINFSGLIVAKLLGIPHFYEANGIQFKARQKYYRSWLTPLVKWIEKWMYKKSNHTFFVGTYGFYWELKSKNWSNIENGVESHLFDFFKERKKKTSIPLNVCFIARLMAHQKPEILIDALVNLKKPKDIELHLIGSGLESIEKQLKDKITVVNHGFQNREAIKHILQDMHVGIIAGSPEFQSTMKIFDYGVSKCAVIAPYITNLKYWFKDELIFFDGTAKDLAVKICQLKNDANALNQSGKKLHDKVKQQFTWDKIYGHVCKTITTQLDQKS